MGLLDYLQKYGEPALGLLSGAAAEPVAGWAGLLGGDVGKTREAMTYQPKTAQGMEGQQALMQALMSAKAAMVDNNPPVRMAVDGFNSLADRAGAASPALGALVKTLPAAAMSFGAPGSAPVRGAFANAGKESAKALAPKMGDALQNYMVKSGGILPMDVWHGSPHKFDKFDSGKIGTGEGNQAYGHGLYLAESPDVAKSYQVALGRPDSAGLSKAQDVAAWAHSQGTNGINPTDVLTDEIARLEKYGKFGSKISRADYDNALEILKNGKAPANGSIYKVDLPDDKIAKMLDYDKPLSQQSAQIQQRIYDSMLDGGFDKSITNHILNNKTGGDLMNELAGRLSVRNPSPVSGSVQASEFLRKSGFPGIRYLDGGSRGTGAGSSNFVVFPGNENILSILERNGMPIK